MTARGFGGFSLNTIFCRKKRKNAFSGSSTFLTSLKPASSPQIRNYIELPFLPKAAFLPWLSKTIWVWPRAVKTKLHPQGLPELNLMKNLGAFSGAYPIKLMELGAQKAPKSLIRLSPVKWCLWTCLCRSSF
jgi:hypothetical protein